MDLWQIVFRVRCWQSLQRLINVLTGPWASLHGLRASLVLQLLEKRPGAEELATEWFALRDRIEGEGGGKFYRHPNDPDSWVFEPYTGRRRVVFSGEPNYHPQEENIEVVLDLNERPSGGAGGQCAAYSIVNFIASLGDAHVRRNIDVDVVSVLYDDGQKFVEGTDASIQAAKEILADWDRVLGYVRDDESVAAK